MIPWYMHTWFLTLFLVVMALLSFLMTAPSFLADAIVDLFEVQPTFKIKDIVSVSINKKNLSEEQIEEFIRKFNKLVFLYQYYDNRTFEGEKIEIEIKKKKRDYTFIIYSKEDYFECIRHKKKKDILYKGKSKEFAILLIEYLKSKDQIAIS